MSSPQASKPVSLVFLMQTSMMGGAEAVALDLAKALDPRRFQVLFLCPGEGKLTRSLRDKGLSYELYRLAKFPSTSARIAGHSVFNPLAGIYDLALLPLAAWRVARVLRASGADAAVTTGLWANFYGQLACRWAGVVCVWHMHELVSAQRAFGLFSRLLDAWARRADHIIAPSKATRDQFSPSVRRKAVLIANGVDTERFRPQERNAALRAQWNVAPQDILIGHMARLTHWKGQVEFIEAAAQVAARLPLARFVVAGGPLFESDAFEGRLKAMARGLGLDGRLTFTGFLEDTPAILAAIDIFVHCSNEPETCPLSLLTAMAAGKPCVLTDIPGHDEIVVTPEQGVFVPARSPAALADALVALAADPGRGELLGAAARRRILEGFSAAAMARECEAFLSGLSTRRG